MSVEVCADSLESALAAITGGATRIELCGSLSDGGVTPSHGLLREVCRVAKGVRVHVLVRPRPGDFLYSSQEIEGWLQTAQTQVMRQDVIHAASCGAHGVSLGMLTPEGRVNMNQLRLFVDLCRGLGLDLTFHRAFDLVRDQRGALEDLIGAGVRRVLTSGGRSNAMEGLDQIHALVQQGRGRVSIMPGGGVTEGNAVTIVCATGVQEVHGTFKRIKPSEMQHTPRHMTFRANPNTSSYASDAAEGAGNLGSAYHKGSKGEGGADDEWSRPVTDAEHVWRVGKLLQEAVGRVAQ